jgi:4-amino-4-deoxy-L-arabinose transferase-like glycosyltransferase
MFPFEWIWDTSLSALLGATLLWATLALAESTRLRDWCAYGLLWGFSLMTNPSLGSLLFFLLAWAAFRTYRLRSLPLSKPALALGLAILCCVPWTIRNYHVFHKFIPLRSNLGLELYIGNNENYDPEHTKWPSPITKEREILRFFKMGERPFMEEEMRKATSFVVAHPGVELKLTGLRIVAFWMGTAAPLQDFLETDSILIKVIFVCNFLAGVGALLGIAALYRQRSTFAFPIAVFPVVFPVLYYVTHTSLRYRHPIDPVVLLLVAIAASWPWAREPGSGARIAA